MAKKPKQNGKGKSSQGPVRDPLTFREVQQMMALEFASLLGEDPSPQETKAERLLDRACDERSPKKAERLVREALALDPGLLEAYEVLADLAPNPDAAIAALETGLQAGEQVLGREMFEDNAGHFWGIHATRPFMQLRHELANRLWGCGRRGEAIAHMQELLRLNPNDNQGVRQLLAGWYLEERRLDDAEELLQRFPERSTSWTWSRALLTYCREGTSERANEELHKANEANRFLPRYLAGLDIFSLEKADYYSPGDEDEGMIFARYYLPAWRSTPGALGWLRKTLNLRDRADSSRPARDIDDSGLDLLPQASDEAWEVDVRQFEEELFLDGENCRPWIILALDSSSGHPLLFRCSAEPFHDDEILEASVDAMIGPAFGEPRRPGKLLLSSSSRAKAFYKKFKRLKVRCEYHPELPAIDQFILQRPDFIRRYVASLGAERADVDVESLGDLPQDAGEIWQLDFRHLPVWIGEGEEAASPSVLLIVDARENLVPAVDIHSDPAEPLHLDRALLKCISFPAIGEPRRPGLVQVRTPESAKKLREVADELGIRLEVSKDLDAWDEAFAELSRTLGGNHPVRPAICELPAATPEQIDAFFATAAAFFRAAPWRMVVGDSILRIECPVLAKSPWFACVMGQMGETFGMALYEDEKYIRELVTERNSDPDPGMRGNSSLVLMFNEKHDTAPQDVAAIAERKLPLAAPEAYPSLLRIKPGMAIQMPLMWEARMMAAALRAVPLYLKERTRQRRSFTVPVLGEEVAVTLEFVG